MLTVEEVENWNAGVKQTAFQPPPGWIYPRGYVAPAPAPPGYRLRVEYDGFLGLEVRWRYERIRLASFRSETASISANAPAA